MNAGEIEAIAVSRATIPMTVIASKSEASRGIAPDRTMGVQDGFSKTGTPTVRVLPLIGGTFPIVLRHRFG